MDREPQAASADGGIRRNQGGAGDPTGGAKQLGPLRPGDHGQRQFDRGTEQGRLTEMMRPGEEPAAGADEALRASPIAGRPVIGQLQNDDLSREAEAREDLDSLLKYVSGARIGLAPALAEATERRLGVGADALVLPREHLEKRGNHGSLESRSPGSPVRYLFALCLLEPVQVVPGPQCVALEPGDNATQQQQRKDPEEKDSPERLRHVGFPRQERESGERSYTAGRRCGQDEALAGSVQPEESFMSSGRRVRSRHNTPRPAAARQDESRPSSIRVPPSPRCARGGGMKSLRVGIVWLAILTCLCLGHSAAGEPASTPLPARSPAYTFLPL